MKSETQLLPKLPQEMLVGTPLKCNGSHDLNLHRPVVHGFVASFFQRATNAPWSKPCFVHRKLGELFRYIHVCRCDRTRTIQRKTLLLKWRYAYFSFQSSFLLCATTHRSLIRVDTICPALSPPVKASAKHWNPTTFADYRRELQGKSNDPSSYSLSLPYAKTPRTP